MILAVVVVFVVGILMGFPLVLTLIGATVAPGLIDPDFAGNIQFVLRSIIGGGDSTSILAAPLFILSGIIMAKGGISEKIFNVFAYLLGHVPGGDPLCRHRYLPVLWCDLRFRHRNLRRSRCHDHSSPSLSGIR